MPDTALWKRDWIQFTNELESHLKHGATSSDLATIFGGARVRWRGIVEDVDIDDLAQLVNVALPERIISVTKGTNAILDGLTLVVSESAISSWLHFAPGDEVTFEATLGEAGSPFATIEFTTLESGNSIVMISASDAVPVT